MTALRARIGGHVLGVLVFLAVLVLWELWAAGDESFEVPTAREVAESAWDVWPTSDFLSETAGSLTRLAAGYAIAALAGIGFGLVMGSSLRTRRMLDPFFELLRAVPVISIVPVAILVLGVGDASRIAVIAFGVVFPILLNTIDGVRTIPPEIRDMASLLHVTRAERLVCVYLPCALPSVFTGLRIALSLGLVMVVISEFTGEGNGLGHFLLVQESLFNYPELYAGLLFLGLLGYVLNTLFVLVERRVLSWHYRAAGE